jgi:hypothetical protein
MISNKNLFKLTSSSDNDTDMQKKIISNAETFCMQTKNIKTCFYVILFN